MKAIIENGGIVRDTNEHGSTTTLGFNQLEVFNEILKAIDLADSKADLMGRMNQVSKCYAYLTPDVCFNEFVKYGFGSNHMWVNQTGFEERLIFVEF